MSLHFMSGVRLDIFTAQSMLALQVANECFTENGADCLVTSAYREGDWSKVLLHGRGFAFDLAVRKLDGTPLDDKVIHRIVDSIIARIGKQSGGQYDILFEEDASASAGWTGRHIHIEYDPASGASRPTGTVT